MNTSRFTTWTFVVCLLISFLLVAHLLFRFITPAVVALIIVSLFSSVHQRLLRLCGGRDYLAAGLATFLVFLGVLIPIVGFMALLAQEGLALFQATQNLTDSPHVADWMNTLKHYVDMVNQNLPPFNAKLSFEKILKASEGFLQAMGLWFYDSIGLIASNILSLVLNFLLTIALVFVFFVSGRATKIFIMELVPLPDDEKERVVTRFRELSRAVFIGNGLISVLEGFLGGLSFFIFGIEGALLWGVLIAITAFLPLIGAAIVIIPATIYLLLNDGMWQALVFLIFNTIHMMCLETLVKPRLIGTKSQMHAALVFMSILAGVQIYGVLGLFYGPLLVTVFLTLVEIYKEHYREKLLND